MIRCCIARNAGKKIAKTNGDGKYIFYMEKHPAEDIIDEVILHEKKYQDMPLDELCSMIDLISPTTDNYPYVIDFRTDIIILRHRHWSDSVFRKMLFTR